MAQILLDCEPICRMPWQLSLADQPWEKEEIFRLRYDVFTREHGYGTGGAATSLTTSGPSAATVPGGQLTAPASELDVDDFDTWCQHLMLRDEARNQLIGTYRLIPGPLAIRHGGFYSATEFDLSCIAGIAPEVLEIGRTCVAPEYRNGLAMQFLWYGLELTLQRQHFNYLLGCASFTVDTADELDRIASYAAAHHRDPEFYCPPLVRCQPVPSPKTVPTTPADEKLLPPLLRSYIRMGATICSPPAWDPEFRSYDFLIVFRRHRTNDHCNAFLARMERQLQVAVRRDRASSSSTELDGVAIAAADHSTL